MTGILKRSKKTILGLDVQLANIESNVANNATNISGEISRATGIENGLQNQITTEKSRVDILNGNDTVTGSVDKKIKDAISTKVNTTDVYTKSEVDTIADTKLDKILTLSTVTSGNKIVTEAELNLKANAADVYNKTEIDTFINGVATSSNTYTKNEVDSSLALKANTADVYTKTETDALVSPKANSSDVYTKAVTDTLLSSKLNTSDTVSAVSAINKVVTQAEISDKVSSSDVYTKSEIDTSLSGKLNTSDAITPVSTNNKLVTSAELSTKANSTDVYTKTQIDTALSGKAEASTAGKVGPSLKTVDETSISNGKILAYNSVTGNLEYVDQDGGALISDTTTNLVDTWSSSKISGELALKANISNVYTKTETDALMASAAQGIEYVVSDLTELNTLVGMDQDSQALVEDTRTIYKYDTANGWETFYQLDATHNHNDLYYTESEIDSALALKADKTEIYTKTQVDNYLSQKAATSTVGKVGASLVSVDETNKADGKVLSYNSATGQLEYVDQDGGAVINDSTTSNTSTWSSTKIDSELSLKADAADMYTKNELDTSLSNKVNVSDVKSPITVSNKVVTESELAGKIDATNVYTKAEIDALDAAKVNVSDVKSAITESNKVVTESELSGKADATSVYSKSEVDTIASGKANTSDVYTKSQVDTALVAKLNTSDTVSPVTGSNKVVTQSEIVGLATTSNIYTKSESDAITDTKFDNTDAVTAVSASNKLVTETELANTVKRDEVKSVISATNKVITETDLTTAINNNNATLATAPFLVIDRPTLSTKTANGLDYTYQFALSKTPHGNKTVNDEILIYNFFTNGDSTTYEGVSLFSDKHGEISVTLDDISEAEMFNTKTIRVCYLSTDSTVEQTGTPGESYANPIIINVPGQFEDQGAGSHDYNMDFSAGAYYKLLFSDGWYAMAVFDANRSGFHTSNTYNYEVRNYGPNNLLYSIAWPGYTDEAQYFIYNWQMTIVPVSGDTYAIRFTRAAEVGGGAF